MKLQLYVYLTSVVAQCISAAALTPLSGAQSFRIDVRTPFNTVKRLFTQWHICGQFIAPPELCGGSREGD